MKKKLICAILTALSVLWIAFIFSNSLEDAVESGAKSSWVYNIVSAILPWVSKLFIRKLGHFAEFAILGLLLAFTVSAYLQPIKSANKKRIAWLAASLPAIIAVASFDEFLQNFSEGRHPAFTDVLIDTAGGLFGILSVIVLMLIILHIRSKKLSK